MARIIAPLDGSSLSERCLGCLGFLKGADVTVELLRVMEAEEEPTGRAKIERYLEKRAETVSKTLDVEVQNRVSHGIPYLAILEEAEAQDVMMVAMSTHGRSGVRQHGIGNVTDKVTRLAPCPTLVVSQSCSTHPHDIDVIIVPVDGSELGEGALPAAGLLAGKLSKPIILLTIVDIQTATVPPMDEELIKRESEASTYLADLRRKIPPAVQATDLVRRGPVVKTLLEEMRQHENALVVMSSHGAEGFRSYRVGRVSDEVLVDAPAPVLLVGPGQAQHMLRAVTG